MSTYGIINTEKQKADTKTKMKKTNKNLNILLLVLAFSVYFSSILFLLPEKALASSNTANLIKLTNEIRIQNNLPELKESETLNKVALSRAQDMLQNNYFSHQSPNGKSFINELEKKKYYFSSAGENLAIDFYENEKIVNSWMQSPAHRQNILNPDFKEIGIGRANDIVVQIFAVPSSRKNGVYLFVNNISDDTQILGAYISSKDTKSISLNLILIACFLAIPSYLVLKNKYI